MRPHPGLSSDFPEASRKSSPLPWQLSLSQPFRISGSALQPCSPAKRPLFHPLPAPPELCLCMEPPCLSRKHLDCGLPPAWPPSAGQTLLVPATWEGVAYGPGGHFKGKRCLGHINFLVCLSPQVKSSLKNKEVQPHGLGLQSRRPA